MWTEEAAVKLDLKDHARKPNNGRALLIPDFALISLPAAETESGVIDWKHLVYGGPHVAMAYSLT